ncbi:Structural maintenance of chromosomes protein 3 [Elasticomyces elasticus]|nr:Structural maintenance of chromosomes protein 3 [Elasticomyces elasticus]KAK5736779.1 Structural maintenance of chromosomes protein 3 [Elasticomyces elasticus]
MSREERGGLLHEGAGSAVMSAYVEVIFDNADQPFPTDTPEVIPRRTIGQKKDECSLNRKNTTRQEAMNMLKTAGFSTSNPYYVVPQGRITAITNMPDAGRLDILKEVAGTRVYEERRAASQKIMDDTEHRRTKIDELLDHIRERLGELEEDKEELRAFQEKDRARRCLEYTIHHEDQEALQEALEKLKAHTKHADDLRTVQEQISEREAELSQLLPEYTAKKEQERALLQQVTDAEIGLNLFWN